MELFPQPHEWPKILWPGISWAEKMLRPVVVYLFLLLMFRRVGKKELGQATLTDLLLVGLISNVVQNSMIGEDSSLIGGCVGGLTMIVTWFVLNQTTARSKAAETVIEGCPTLLIREGELLRENLKKEAFSESELFAAIRQAGIQELSEVRFAIMEEDGNISVLKKSDTKEAPGAIPEVWRVAIERSQERNPQA